MSSSTSLANIHEELRNKIDEEITKLEARIIDLKTKRNTLSPFARLHPEIIQDIFVLASISFPRKGATTSLAITWVCRSWRFLALETAGMWRHVDFLNPDRIQVALSRARSRLISIHVLLPRDYADDLTRHAFASVCLSNLSRIHSLMIDPMGSVGMDTFPRLNPLWVTPAPFLVTLILRRVSLPPTLFSGVFLALQGLSLDECDFDWASLPIHSKIQSMSISQPARKTSAEDMVQKIWIIAPNVERLSIRNSILPLPTTTTSQVLDPPERHQLQNLRSFAWYETSAPVISYIFNQLSAPQPPNPLSNSNIGYSVYMEGTAESQHDAVQSFVEFRGLRRWPVTHLDVSLLTLVGETSRIVLTMTENRSTSSMAMVDSDSDSDPDPDHFVVLSFKTTGDHPSLSHLPPLLDSLPLPPIKSLSLSGNGGDDTNEDHTRGSTELIDYFHTNGRVEWLEVTVPFVPTFTRVIQSQNDVFRNAYEDTDVDDDADDEHEHVHVHVQTKPELHNDVLSFPQLTVLRYIGEKGDPILGQDNFIILSDWLAWRKLIGIGITLLVFMDITIPSGLRDEMGMLFDGMVEVEYQRIREVNGSGGGGGGGDSSDESSWYGD